MDETFPFINLESTLLCFEANKKTRINIKKVCVIVYRAGETIKN